MAELVGFRLEAPMAAFGDLAVGERRGSQRRPSQSTLAGLIAAALGLGRETSGREDLAAGLFFVLRADGIGSPLADFHTVQMPPQRKGRHYATRRAELAVKDDLGTVVSRRDYWTDVVFTVLVWPRPAPLSEAVIPKGVVPEMAVIAAALNRPAFTLFAGRRCCPLGAPLGATVLVAETILEAFAAYDAGRDHHCPPATVTPLKEREIFCDAAMPAERLAGLTAIRTDRRRDRPLGRSPWQFGLRQEIITRAGGEAP